ncbi:MAG: hypothetical protein JSV86_09915 [Gemmatimonadota bacterium]|nr:MAG: hypothetical protein JSV86_09915 [Gemmatimonadota bacterium]
MTANPVKPSLLLPSGATISVVAALLEGLGVAGPAALALALAGAVSAAAAWALAVRKSGEAGYLGVRFFSILAIALAISSLFVGVDAGWLGMIGVIGLWIAAGGAGVEWLRGQTYGGET